METTCRVGCFTAAHAQYSLPNELECRPCATLSYAGSVSAVSLALFYSSSSRAQRGLPSELQTETMCHEPIRQQLVLSSGPHSQLKHYGMYVSLLFHFQTQISRLLFQIWMHKLLLLVSSLNWTSNLRLTQFASTFPKALGQSNFDGGRKDAARNEKLAFYTQAFHDHLWKQAWFLFVSLFKSKSLIQDSVL